jgi:hypothetical protein
VLDGKMTGVKLICHANNGQIIIKFSPVDHQEQNDFPAPFYYI